MTSAAGNVTQQADIVLEIKDRVSRHARAIADQGKNMASQYTIVNRTLERGNKIIQKAGASLRDYANSSHMAAKSMQALQSARGVISTIGQTVVSSSAATAAITAYSGALIRVPLYAGAAQVAIMGQQKRMMGLIATMKVGVAWMIAYGVALFKSLIMADLGAVKALTLMNVQLSVVIVKLTAAAVRIPIVGVALKFLGVQAVKTGLSMGVLWGAMTAVTVVGGLLIGAIAILGALGTAMALAGGDKAFRTAMGGINFYTAILAADDGNLQKTINKVKILTDAFGTKDTLELIESDQEKILGLIARLDKDTLTTIAKDAKELSDAFGLSDSKAFTVAAGAATGKVDDWKGLAEATHGFVTDILAYNNLGDTADQFPIGPDATVRKNMEAIGEILLGWWTTIKNISAWFSQWTTGALLTALTLFNNIGRAVVKIYEGLQKISELEWTSGMKKIVEGVKDIHAETSGIVGAGAGAIAGAKVGARRGWKGAAVGAVFGGIAGAAVGDAAAKKIEEWQMRSDEIESDTRERNVDMMKGGAFWDKILGALALMASNPRQYHSGGVIQGAPGQAVPIVAHGGEQILRRDQRNMGGGGESGPTIIKLMVDRQVLGEVVVNGLTRRMRYQSGMLHGSI